MVEYCHEIFVLSRILMQYLLTRVKYTVHNTTMKTIWIICFVIFSLYFQCSNSTPALEEVDDDDLLNLFRTEKYVVVLFSKKECSKCDEIEDELIGVREDLVDELNAWVVKVINSNLAKIYSPTKEPALVFFRHGVPLLYHGPINEDSILHTFRENKEPTVRELRDSTFEHLTQAASGATTGDWFIMFYSTECIDCQRLTARWEAVGAALKTRMNIARINKRENGAITSRRFSVYEVPTFILFRQGKMYRYNFPTHDIDSFINFATEGFKKIARAESVPVPKSPFDDLTQMIADYIRENKWLWGVAGVTFLTGVALAVWLQSQTKQSEKKKEKKSKKSSDSKKSDNSRNSESSKKTK